MLVFPGRSHVVKLSKTLDFSFDFLVFVMMIGNGSNGLAGRPPLSHTPVCLRSSMTASVLLKHHHCYQARG